MMYLIRNKEKQRHFLWGILAGGILLLAVLVGESARYPAASGKYHIREWIGEQITVLICPVSGFLEDAETVVTWKEFFYSIPFCQSPLYLYLKEDTGGTGMSISYETLTLKEGRDEENDIGAEGTAFYGDTTETASTVVQEYPVLTDSAVPLSEILPGAAGGFTIKNFVPATQKSVVYNMEELRDYSFLLNHFYIVDSGTGVTAEQINAQRMLSQNMTIDREVDGPQILIYHTHSQEAFADSVPGDPTMGILGAGEYLKEILEEKYGYQVLHHTVSYDNREHNYAYSYAEPEIRALLEKYPSIQVVIDLHRDEMAEGTRLVTQLNGQPTAQFMFFNGMSYLNELGHIDYLSNPNLETNLAFSFQMQLMTNTYYPGLARRIYLKGYRYNMHLAGKYLLIELGAQNNTEQEIRNACHPLADVLDRVLSGRDSF